MDTLWNQSEKTIYNAVIITMDADFRVIEDGFITIKDGIITEIGKGKPNHNLGNLIDANRQIIIPGFVNAHTHLAMTLFRGLADDLPLHDWLSNHIWPAEAKHVSEQNVRIGARLGLAELIRTGTTTFSDMYFFADATAEETAKAGLRAVMGEAILDFPTNNYPGVDEAFNKAISFIEKWKDHPLIHPGMIVHSTYTCSRETLMRAKEIANIHQVPFSIHVSETTEEIEQVLKNQGYSPVNYLNELGLINSRLAAVHGVWLSEPEMKVMAENHASLVHCPTSNLKLGSGIAPIPKIMQSGVNVALGTDGCASNNNLDMVEEMRLAALIHKGKQHNPELITAREALAMATINGAKALRLDQVTGSLEVGKSADLLMINTQNTFMTPIFDYYSAIVYSMNSSCIDSVIVHGKPLMMERKLLTIPNIPGSVKLIQ